MNADKKIAIQQRLIESLSAENQQLREETEQLREALEAERSLPREGYDRAKELMAELEHKIHEYHDLIAEARSLRSDYMDKINRLHKITIQYKKNTKKMTASIQKIIK